jgi:hypothetical protein
VVAARFFSNFNLLAMRNKIFLLSVMLCAFSASLKAQSIPQARVSQEVYPSTLFEPNYSNELFRNKFNLVSYGSDTVVWFVDLYGFRAFMAQGAPTDSGGVVVTQFPILGDGGSTNPVRFAPGSISGQYWAWNGTNWALQNAPSGANIYNTDDALTGNRVLDGDSHDLTFTNLSGFELLSNGIVNTIAGGAITEQGDSYNLTSLKNADFHTEGNLSFFLDANASEAFFFDNSTTLKGLQYGDDYCPTILANPNSIPSVECVAQMINDSLGGILGLPPGTINQTLRYSGTNTLQANSEIFNNGNQVSIGTTVFPSAYELYILGNLRANQKAYFGNAIGKGPHPNATLAINDSTSATPSILAINNRSNTIHADAELILHCRSGSAASLIHWYNDGAGESNFYHAGVGDSFNEWRLCANQDTSIANGLVMSVNSTKNVGFWISGKTDGQVNFQAQDDEGTIPPPIALTLGADPDPGLRVDGQIWYADDLVDDLRLQSGSDTYTIAKNLKNSAVLDFPSINPTLSSALPITVTGAQVGDQVVLGWEPGVQVNGVLFSAYVQAANTVRVVATNVNGAPVDLASGLFTARCFH